MKFIFLSFFFHILFAAKKVEDFSSHIYDLAAKIVEKLDPNNNVLVSPFSVDNALLLAAAGSSGKTFKEIIQFLNLKDYKESKEIVADEKVIGLFTPVKPYISSNSIWVNKKFKINPDFEKSAEKSFNSSLISADFSAKVIVPKINSWISEKTENKFNNVVTKIDSSSLYLINTLLYTGNWEHPFSKSESYTGQFTRLDKTPVEAIFIQQKQDLSYYSDKEIAAAVLPFSGGPSLLVIKPQAEGEKALQSVVKNLAFSKIDTILTKAKRSKLNVVLPRLTTSVSLSLKEVLKKLGLSIPFASKADFSQITSKSVSVGDILHEVAFSVDEDGAVSAASTLPVETAPPSTGKPKKEKKLTEFTVDRPFVFVLLDGKTPLFEGVIRTVNPSAPTDASKKAEL